MGPVSVTYSENLGKGYRYTQMNYWKLEIPLCFSLCPFTQDASAQVFLYQVLVWRYFLVPVPATNSMGIVPIY